MSSRDQNSGFTHPPFPLYSGRGRGNATIANKPSCLWGENNLELRINTRILNQNKKAGTFRKRSKNNPTGFCTSMCSLDCPKAPITLSVKTENISLARNPGLPDRHA